MNKGVIKIKRYGLIFATMMFSLFALFSSFACGTKTDVVIYTAFEDFRVVKLKEMLKEEFSEFNIDVQYVSSGTIAAKMKAEGTKIQADIVLDVDYGYLQGLSELLEVQEEELCTLFLDELVPAERTFCRFPDSARVSLLTELFWAIKRCRRTILI